MTGGRLILAVAIGNIPADFDTVGVPFRRRGRITNSHLAALRAILDGEQPVDYSDEELTFSGTFFPRPSNQPLWVCGGSEPGLTRAATFGDGWLTVYTDTARYQSLETRFAELLEERGRDRRSVTCGYETYVCVGRTRQEAEDISRASVVKKFGDMEKAAEVCIIGDADECADRVAQYHAVGADHIELKFVCHDVTQLAEMMERTAARLLS
jgi:alkanesulfonate monooxygenase SsuD/methylene tetrahydromethanopterin reductase-like flavin-dependent oxidoreductase (luciferase family)